MFELSLLRHECTPYCSIYLHTCLQVIRYRAAFHDHDYGGTGSLGLLAVEEAVRSFG